MDMKGKLEFNFMNPYFNSIPLYIYASYAFSLCANNCNLSNQISPNTFKKGDHDVHNIYLKYMPYININTNQKVKKIKQNRGKP